MPCSDSSSSMVIKMDPQDRFVTFEYAKITCGREISGSTGLAEYLLGRTLPEILSIPFPQIVADLEIPLEEDQFILYLEWDVLRAGIALYLGLEDPHIDSDRCVITSISVDESGTEVAEVVRPPKELPKILPCNLADQQSLN